MLRTLLLLLIALEINAQPVITNSLTLPSINTNYIFKQSGIVSPPTTSGANVTWDFGNDSLGTMGDLTIVNLSSAIDAGSFSTANFVRKLVVPAWSMESYDFYNNTTTHYKLLGNSSNLASSTIYGIPQTVLIYPFSYGASTTNTFTVGPITYTETLTYDGYGTVIIDGRIYNNVVKIHSETPGLNDSYYFYTTSPLFNFLIFNGFDNSLIYYEGTAVSVDEIDIAKTVSVYPNPAREKINFHNSGNKPVKLIISTSDGKIVLEKTLNEDLSIPTSGLAKGNYTYSILRDGLKAGGVFVVE
jgi:hypothetical protein